MKLASALVFADGSTQTTAAIGVTSGAATIDFGSFPGSNEAFVDVSGQTAILATSRVEASMMAEVSGSHTVNDATYAAMLITLSCGVPTAGTGFRIYARSPERLEGTFKVRWSYSN